MFFDGKEGTWHGCHDKTLRQIPQCSSTIMCIGDEYHAATQQLRHWKSFCREQICTAEYAERFGLVATPFFFFSVAGFNPRTASPLTTRTRQMAKESNAVGLCRLLRVLPGKNRTKRGMKWNCGHSEASFSHSGPGGESREFILLLVRQRTAFRNKNLTSFSHELDRKSVV